MATATTATTTRGGKAAGKQAVTRVRGKLAPGGSARGLNADDVAITLDDPEIADVVALVRSDGGAPIGAYREPSPAWPRR